MSRLWVFFASTLLAACGSEEHQDLKQWMTDQAKDMRPEVPKLPEKKETPTPAYSGGDLESPFSSAKIVVQQELAAERERFSPTKNRAQEFLEAFPLESLKLTGVLMHGKKPVAIIQSSEGARGVEVGNYMGQNLGRVIEITKEEVRVEETIKDPKQGWMKQEKVLYLQGGEGVKK